MFMSIGYLAGSADIMSKENDPPPAPDYTAAAQQTAAGDLAGARAAASANRPNEYTPFGAKTWLQTGPDSWSSSISLSPVQQQIFDTNQSGQLDMANVGRQATNAAGAAISNPFSLSSLGAMPDANANRQNVMNAMLSRVNSQNASDVDAKRSELIASGIPMGSKAYQGEMSALGSRLTDARQQAEIAANGQAQQQMGMNLDSRRQQISEALLQRQTPLNEALALRSGAQVQMPTFSPTANQVTTGGANALTAAQAQNNAAMSAYQGQQAQNNAAMSGLFNLGAAWLGS